MMNIEVEFNGEYDILFPMSLYTFNNVLKNNDIQNIYLHFKGNHLKCDDIVYNFLFLQKSTTALRSLNFQNQGSQKCNAKLTAIYYRNVLHTAN